MTDSKPRTIHYKRAIFSEGTEDLEALLRAALAPASAAYLADDRQESFSDEASSFRLINQTRDFSGMLFGEFVIYEPGKRQPLLDLSQQAEYYPLQAKEPAENQAYADDIFYFGIRGNDLVVSQTRSIKTRELETHLAWLLTTCCQGLLNPDTSLVLQDQPGNDVYERVASTEAKSLKIGTSLTASRLTVPSNQEVNSEAQSARFSLTGIAGEAIKAVIGSSAYEGLDFSEDLDEANLKVTLVLSYLRSTTQEGQRAIDELASTFRHVDGVDYELKLKNGGVVRGEDMKISTRINVTFRSSGLPDLTDLYRKMHDWLLQNLLAQLNGD